MTKVIHVEYDDGALNHWRKTNLKDGEEVRVIIIECNLSIYRGILDKASYKELRKLEEEAQLKS